MNAIESINTKRGCKVRVLEAGSGAPLVFLHGAGGLFPENPFLDHLAKRYHVYAPELPGLRRIDRRRAARRHARLRAARLGRRRDARPRAPASRRPFDGRHDRRGDGRASRRTISRKLVLVSPAGLWIPEHPIPDLFALLPFEFAEAALPRPGGGAGAAHRRPRLQQPRGARRVLHRQLPGAWAMAGKILFPIPNRRLAKRLYRVRAETLLVWGTSDALIGDALRRTLARGHRGIEAGADPGSGSHGAVRAARGVRVGGRRIPRLRRSRWEPQKTRS